MAFPLTEMIKRDLMERNEQIAREVRLRVQVEDLTKQLEAERALRREIAADLAKIREQFDALTK